MTSIVTIVVPALNEERYIADCLHPLVDQAEAMGGDVLVVDGGSTDRTRPIVRAIAADHPCVRLIDNPRRIQSAGVNLAARLSSAPVLVRADAHAHYPPGFIGACLQALEAHGATSVVVPMITAGPDGFARAVAAAQNSRLGNGGSPHRAGRTSGWVDHGHHAAFDRAFFLRLGGYDETFTHNEDAEFDRRAVLAGGQIWMCGDAPVTYIPRRTVGALARQYLRHGSGRAMMLHKHALTPKPRQLLPVFALGAVILGIVLAPLHPAFLLLPFAYVALCLLGGMVIGLRAGDAWQSASGVAAVTMHMAWAWGFVRTTVVLWLRRRPVAQPAAVT